MWRAVWQRLGLGYIILLPALAFIGVMLHQGLEVLCFQFGPVLEKATGRDFGKWGSADGRAIWWLACHSQSTLMLMLLPWWIGAWRLLRQRKDISPHEYWRVIFSVSSAVILYLAVVASFFASIMRKVCFAGAYVAESTLLSSSIGIAFLLFVILVVAAMFRLRTKASNQ